ncbi:winged helix-turn-helix domain-containing protein [Bowmanella dokdonensis]|uniref:Winged helix-turn-helix domain-containing protein n=1 Tax=Bowmanella dokdonensis TaxID=751969 RepID=A0A939IPR5_9ALTE|nr:winged helix-turn-helix domain-containing protein [Bowmanella dokdonensis]MBN7826155.1 winged helix-turn-helix domain-containing protein [Bowmanella dokdonensis]
MNKQFRLGEAAVDLTRNQIHLAGRDITLQPKVMAVLAELVRARGQVVSQEQLMQQIWAGTIVSPNTLQRCIAQLRKALGDDSRQQRVIRTHAKQGYSLELPVCFDRQDKERSRSSSRKRRSSRRYLALTALLPLLLALSSIGFYSSQDPAGRYGKLSYLTTTEGKESFASYSPDGRYMVFHRYEGLCENHLWSKDLASQEETRLTGAAEYFQQHSFAPGGDRLAFVGKNLCGKDGVPECWELKTLDFAAALNGPQQPQTRVSCDEGMLYGAQWMNNGSIAMLKRPEDGHWRLITYHLRDETEQTLFAPPDQRLYNLAYSPGLDRLATLGKTTNGRNQLTLLSSKGKVLNTMTLVLPVALSRYELLELSFHPAEEKLLIYGPIHQFEVDLNGQVTRIDTQAAEAIDSLVYAPHADRLLGTYGVIDWDFYPHALPGQAEDPMTMPEPLDSTFVDKEARFQPQGSHIAFVSNRSGVDQVWLVAQQRVWQLSRFESGAIAGLAWSPSGQQLLVNHNDGLSLLDLDGGIRQLDQPFAVKQLYQWTGDGHVLFSSEVDWQQQAVAYHLASGQWRRLDVGDSIWMQADAKGQFYSLDKHGQIRRLASEDGAQSALVLDDIAKRFVLGNDLLLAVDKQNNLVSYDLARQQPLDSQALALPSLYVDDSNGRQALIARISAARQDIVELRR